MWEKLASRGHSDADLRRYSLRKLILLYEMASVNEAGEKLIDLTNARVAFGSVMGGKKGHSAFIKQLKQLRRASNLVERDEAERVRSELLANGIRLKRK